MQFKRPRTKCELCPLKDHKHVYSELVAGEAKPKLAILGEAPGREEDRDGKPFTGPSGKLVNWALHECGVARNNVYVANSICCMPTGQAMDTLEASEALSYCRAGLYDELIAQYDRGLRVLIALGQIAMKQLGLDGKVGTYRGSLMTVVLPGDKKLTVIPTYHPSMVLRMNWKRSNGGTAKGAVEWLADWQKAARIASEGGAEVKQLREIFELNPTVEQIEEFCNLAICENKLVAVDIETSGLGFDACKIVVVGLAIDSERAMCVPFLKENATPCFTNGNWERVKNALKKLFSTCKQVYQNCFFDVPRLRAFGFPIPYKLIAHDTLVLHHSLAGELPHDLGYIVSVYGRTPYWKDDFKNRTGTIYEMDQLEMRRYNLRDCVVLHQILATMLRDLKELDLEDIYYKEALPLIEPVMEMTQYGVGIDLGRVKRYKVDLEKRVEQGTAELYQLGNLPPEFNVASTSHMRWFLYGEPITAFAKIDERDAKAKERGVVGDSKIEEAKDKLAKIELAIAVAERDHKSTVALEKRLVAARAALDKRLLPKAQTQIERDIEALRVVRDTVRPLYQLANWRPLTTDSGLLATDKEGLLSFKIALTNRRLEALSFKLKDGTEEVAAIDKLLAFIDMLGKVSLYRKLISTYTNFQPWADGRIHPYFKLHGTASGRLSCIGGECAIATNRGVFTMSEYAHERGDKIVSHTGVEREIKAKYEQGVQQVYRLTLTNGRSIISTIDHKFLTPQGWKKLGDLDINSEVYYVSVDDGFEVSGDVRSCCEDVLGRPFETDSSRCRKSCRCKRSHDFGNTENTLHTRKTQDRESYSIFALETRKEKSVLWEKRLGVPKLERNMSGQQRTFYSSAWLEASVCASNGVCQGARGNRGTATEKLYSPSYRRESCEQHDRQPGSMHECGASKATPKVGRVGSKSFVGALPVFDLEVEVDHSFVCEGFIVHNCTQPNAQNFPAVREDADDVRNAIRGFFVARSGWKMISADYVNLEAQLLAYSTLEPELVDVFTHGLNLHDVNTQALFGVTPDSPGWKSCRKAAKIDFFANKCYGGSDYAIYQKIILEVPELRMTYAEYAAANAKWFAAHPLYSSWAARVRNEVRQRRQARTPFGRVRFFLDNDRDIEKEALNHMIQSSGASLVNRAMVRIERKLRAKGMKTRFVMQVHDELIIEAPDDEVECAKKILVEEMSRPFEFLGFTRSIPVEAAVGSDLAHL